MNILITWMNDGTIEPSDEIIGICVKYIEDEMIYGTGCT